MRSWMLCGLLLHYGGSRSSPADDLIVPVVRPGCVDESEETDPNLKLFVYIIGKAALPGPIGELILTHTSNQIVEALQHPFGKKDPFSLKAIKMLERGQAPSWELIRKEGHVELAKLLALNAYLKLRAQHPRDEDEGVILKNLQTGIIDALKGQLDTAFVLREADYKLKLSEIIGHPPLSKDQEMLRRLAATIQDLSQMDPEKQEATIDDLIREEAGLPPSQETVDKGMRDYENGICPPPCGQPHSSCKTGATCQGNEAALKKGSLFHRLRDSSGPALCRLLKGVSKLSVTERQKIGSHLLRYTANLEDGVVRLKVELEAAKSSGNTSKIDLLVSKILAKERTIRIFKCDSAKK